MEKKKASYIIDHVFFKDNPDEDMTAYEMNYIRNRYTNDKGEVDQTKLIDIMYACYKLGYGKACINAGKELPHHKS